MVTVFLMLITEQMSNISLILFLVEQSNVSRTCNIKDMFFTCTFTPIPHRMLHLLMLDLFKLFPVYCIVQVMVIMISFRLTKITNDKYINVLH